MTPRSTRTEIARRQAWVQYLAREGYNQAQMSERFGVSASVVGNDCAELGIKVSRTRNPALPMDPVNWREDLAPGTAPGRLARSGIIGECLSLLEHLQGREALFQLATLAEEEEAPWDQVVKMRELRGYVRDLCRVIDDPAFRKQVRKDPLHYRGMRS